MQTSQPHVSNEACGPLPSEASQVITGGTSLTVEEVDENRRRHGIEDMARDRDVGIA